MEKYAKGKGQNRSTKNGHFALSTDGGDTTTRNWIETSGLLPTFNQERYHIISYVKFIVPILRYIRPWVRRQKVS